MITIEDIFAHVKNMGKQNFYAEDLAKKIVEKFMTETTYTVQWIAAQQLDLIDFFNTFTPKKKVVDKKVLLNRNGVLSTAFFCCKTKSNRLEDKIEILWDMLQKNGSINKQDKNVYELIYSIMEFGLVYYEKYILKQQKKAKSFCIDTDAILKLQMMD